MARQKSRGAKRVYGKELDDLIRSRPETGITMREIAEKVGCSLSNVHSRQARLKRSDIRKGIPPEVVEYEFHGPNKYAGHKWKDRRSVVGQKAEENWPRAKVEASASSSPGELARSMPDVDKSLTRVQRARMLEVLTDEDTEKVLTCLVHDEVAPAVTVQALKNLADLKAKNRPAERKGPPDPLNRFERVERLAVLLDCAGKSEAGEAWVKAFGEDRNGQGTDRCVVDSKPDSGDAGQSASHLRDGD